MPRTIRSTAPRFGDRLAIGYVRRRLHNRLSQMANTIKLAD